MGFGVSIIEMPTDHFPLVMKTPSRCHRTIDRLPNSIWKIFAALIVLSCSFLPSVSRASIAYGSINNFDTVNDTGHDCHGFEIEIEDCHSTDITYTYNYNHYGAPNIREDNSIAGHPKCIIRWESKKKADGSWAAYTAIPSAPIAPTNGHMFTNPNVNFGGEHFGVGYSVAVTNVKYNWLIDDGAGALVHGGAVQVSTPSFVYYPPVVGNPAQVQAVIAPPPPPAPEPKEFGKAIWVKEIRTTSHNNKKVKLRDLVSDDPEDANDKNWKNGEPDEVETEWEILQKDYGKADGGPKNNKPAAAEDLPGGDEVVTRRYEFFKYIGPLDTETGEAMAENVAADGIHGVGTKVINGAEVNLANVEIVGEFTGSQMAAVDIEAAVGLIDHVGEGRINTPFAGRKLVVEGVFPFTCTQTGDLPAGMSFDLETGILSGTPTESGEFQFKVTATDDVNPEVAKNYILRIAAAGLALAPASILDTTSLPVGSGTTTGDGSFAPGSEVTVDAVPAAGFRFVNWTDNGTVVSEVSSYTFTIDVNHSLVANFAEDVVQHEILASALPLAGGTVVGGGMKDEGSSVTLIAVPNAGYSFVNWTENGTQVGGAINYTFTVTASRTLVANFAAIPTYAVTTNASPLAGGTTTGGGTFNGGSSVTVTATANAGYVFTNWTVNGNVVSSAASYTFTLNAARSLVANFIAAGLAKTINTSASPTAGGTTSGGGNYATGESATVVAVPSPGYKFSKWQEGSTNVSTSPSYTFTVAANRNLVAKFTEAFVITATSSPPDGGETEMDSLTYKTGENAKAKAFPAVGYTFLNWTENGVVVSSDVSYSFNVTGNRTLVANFVSENGVTVTTSAAPSIGGTTDGAGAYQLDDIVTVSAIANPGYAFLNWTAAGAVMSEEADYTFTAEENVSLVAHFAQAIVIDTSSLPAGGGVALGGGEYATGANAMLEAVANPGFVFTNWTENGAVVSSTPSYSFIVAGSRSLVANFIQGYTITASGWPLGGCTVLGAGTVTNGASVTLVAVATAGYSFENWTDANGSVVSTEPSYTFTPVADGDYTAHFSTGLAGVHFNFDSGLPGLALHTPVPFTQTVAGLTATFSSPNAEPPTIETEASTGFALSKFAAHFIAPSSTNGTVIEIQFDLPVSGVSFNFATVEAPEVMVGSNLSLTAIDHSSGEPVVVGTALAHGTREQGDSMPTGTMTFNTDVSFDSIRIELATFPEGAQKWLMDNLIVSPTGSTGGSMLLANPNWNITLTSFGYSDYLLDNTPGFEGREYLSGEWASAVAYTKDGVDVAPTWLDPNFLYPDWPTNSTFQVVHGIHLVGANLDGLPIAESIIANADLEITLRFEMVDTVVGTPMGIKPASGGAAGSVDSNRYVLNQSFQVRNISGAAITNVQLFQLMHGLTSQQGVYDNRLYTGKLSEYRYDATLHGIDASAAGAGSSTVGLEDYICFQSKIAPTAFEIGHYGIEGVNGDDHFSGKPSDGVHLSIEHNWQGGNYAPRQGRDNFAPANRWIAGGQRWSLGTIANGQSATFDIILSLLTGTKVTVVDGGGGGGNGGNHGGGSCNGGSSHVGGVDFDFDDVVAEGTFFGEYAEADDDEMTEREDDGDFALPTFARPGDGTVTQLWNLSYNGSHNGLIRLKFAYDPTLLPAGFDHNKLIIYHFNGTVWEKLPSLVDSVNHTVSAVTTSLSPFALGLNPTPSGTAYEQPILAGGNGYLSARHTVNGGPSDQFVWDGFTVASAQTIREIQWTGTRTGAAPVGFEITLNTSTSIGGTTYVATDAASETPTAVNGVYAYKYKLPTAFALTANQAYWLKIVAIQNDSANWKWSAGTTGNGNHVTQVPLAGGGAQYSTVAGDASFSLLTQTSAIPVTISVANFPVAGGSASGAGVFDSGSEISLIAQPAFGYIFNNWTKDGTVVSTSPTLNLTATAASSFQANFLAIPPVAMSATAGGGMKLSWPAADAGWILEESTDLQTWTPSAQPLTNINGQNSVNINTSGSKCFFRLVRP